MTIQPFCIKMINGLVIIFSNVKDNKANVPLTEVVFTQAEMFS